MPRAKRTRQQTLRNRRAKKAGRGALPSRKSKTPERKRTAAATLAGLGLECSGRSQGGSRSKIKKLTAKMTAETDQRQQQEAERQQRLAERWQQTTGRW